MAEALLVDDHLLLTVLLDTEPPELRPRGGVLFTSGLWYHRLCRAVGASTVTGSLSRRLRSASLDASAAVAAALVKLPADIGLLSLRELARPMAALVNGGVRLNLLSLEALAAAEIIGATIVLAEQDENPTLVAAAAARGVRVRILATS